MSKLIYKEESYNIIGKCFKVHGELGHGFLEVVYKDALETEFAQNAVAFGREVQFDVFYNGTKLHHKFFADFTVYNKIILEVKAADGLNDTFFGQCRNYLKVSGYRLALLVNFGTPELQFKRIIL